MADLVDESKHLAKHWIREVQLKNKALYDEKRVDRNFVVGDRVLVYTPVRKVGKSEKLLHRFFGPFIVVDVKSPVNLLVESAKSGKREVVHVSRVKAFIEVVDEEIDDDIDVFTDNVDRGFDNACVDAVDLSIDNEIDTGFDKIVARGCDQPPEVAVSSCSSKEPNRNNAIGECSEKINKQVRFSDGIEIINERTNETNGGKQNIGRFGRLSKPPIRLGFE